LGVRLRDFDEKKNGSTMIDSNGDEIQRLYTREATDTLYDEVERHEAELRRLRGELAVLWVERNDLRALCDTDEDFSEGMWPIFWRTRDALDAAEAREAVRRKNGNWVGVALAAAFLLGGYFGLLLGLA
jgi:hypothetical protein